MKNNDVENEKKDKPSKKKSKQRTTYTNKEIPVLGILNKLVIEKPFMPLADSLNPFSGFDGYKSLMFSQLISKIYSFALDCVEQVWLVGNDRDIRLAKASLYNKREEIKSLIKEIMPLEASKVPSHQYIRRCEFYPPILVSFVKHIWLELKRLYANIRKDKRWETKDRDWKRRKAVENYLEKQCEEDFELFCYCLNRFLGLKPFREKEELLKNISVKVIYSKGDAYSNIALRIISCFADCSYDRLFEIYLNNGKPSNQKKIN